MKINVEENLIDQSEANSTLIENEIENFLGTTEGHKIISDIELLKEMGFDEKMINKVYILLRPQNIDRAIDYMTEINGIYNHNFFESANPKEKNLCFIFKKRRQNHMDYIPDLSREENNDEEDIKKINEEIDKDNNDNIDNNKDVKYVMKK